MTYKKTDFVPFSADAQRSIANLDAAYEQLVDIEREIEAMPTSMFWQRKNGKDYLAVKKTTSDSGTTQGLRSPWTERQLAEYATERERLQVRRASLSALVQDRVKLCRALRLPQLAEQQGRLLRALDLQGLLGYDVLVVGTNAFAAYEMVSGARFPVGNEATEDFDLAWCRDTRVSLAAIAPPAPQQATSGRASLMSVPKRIDSTYAINRRKPYQAVNDAGYGVGAVGCAQHPPAAKQRGFRAYGDASGAGMVAPWHTRAMRGDDEQAGQLPAVRTRSALDGRAQTLAQFQTRTQSSQEGQRCAPRECAVGRQPVLLAGQLSDLDFVLELPPELRDLFAAWAEQSGFDPTNPSA